MIPAALADRIDPRLKAAHEDLLHRVRWHRSPMRRVTRAFVRQHGLTVQAGPFAGMRYPEYAVGRGELVVAQLLGAYEREIAPAIEEVIGGGYEQIVDVGASDGYYAVGLARRSAASVVHAFEMNPFPARVCRALAAENDVADRVRMHGECTIETLQALPEARTFVLCDCEGGEDVLMDPGAVPWLARAALIVELHEFAAPGIEQRIRARFEPTHDVEVIHTTQRHIADYPALMDTTGISYVDRDLGVSEFRPRPMAWAVLRPRAAA